MSQTILFLFTFARLAVAEQRRTQGTKISEHAKGNIRSQLIFVDIDERDHELIVSYSSLSFSCLSLLSHAGQSHALTLKLFENIK